MDGALPAETRLGCVQVPLGHERNSPLTVVSIVIVTVARPRRSETTFTEQLRGSLARNGLITSQSSWLELFRLHYSSDAFGADARVASRRHATFLALSA